MSNQAAHIDTDATHYATGTPSRVRELLERFIRSGQRVRLFYGDTETGRAYTEEFNVTGRLSRTSGRIKCPILLANAASRGGHIVSTNAIVAIATGPDEFAYRHPTFSVGEWTIAPAESAGFVECAKRDGELIAQFTKPGVAARYVAFMTGVRFGK